MAYPVDRVSGGVEGQSLSKNVHKNAYEFKSSILSLTTLHKLHELLIIHTRNAGCS